MPDRREASASFLGRSTANCEAPRYGDVGALRAVEPSRDASICSSGDVWYVKVELSMCSGYER